MRYCSCTMKTVSDRIPNNTSEPLCGWRSSSRYLIGWERHLVIINLDALLSILKYIFSCCKNVYLGSSERFGRFVHDKKISKNLCRARDWSSSFSVFINRYVYMGLYYWFILSVHNVWYIIEILGDLLEIGITQPNIRQKILDAINEINKE